MVTAGTGTGSAGTPGTTMIRFKDYEVIGAADFFLPKIINVKQIKHMKIKFDHKLI